MEQRHGLDLDEDLTRAIITTIALGRTRRVSNANELKACIDEGVVFTHVLDATTERWRLMINGRWIDVVVRGLVIVTVLPAVAALKRAKPCHAGRRRKPFEYDAEEAH